MTTTNEGPAVMAGPAQASAGAETGSSSKDGMSVAQVRLSVEWLVEQERQLRGEQLRHQAEADDFAAWRGRVIECLRNLHGLSYDSIAQRLGGVTRAQVEYLAKGRKR